MPVNIARMEWNDNKTADVDRKPWKFAFTTNKFVIEFVMLLLLIIKTTVKEKFKYKVVNTTAF